MLPTPILVDARNWADLKPALITRMSSASIVGFDIETEDSRAHDGIKQFRGARTARVFDINRTTVCGFSLYFDGDEARFYINLAHADVENRIPWLEAKELLDAKPASAPWICHKAPFELTMMSLSLGYKLSNVICTLQMAVSAYDADQYDMAKFAGSNLGGMYALMHDVVREFQGYEMGKDMTPAQADLFYKVVAKESDAGHSYNGFVDDLTYGYSLKAAVKSWFDFKMTTFDECLRGKAHMGELTGEEVADYGSDDAYWCVRLFHRLLQHMMETNPKAWDVFINQENPMIYVYADVWQQGLRLNVPAIAERRATERSDCAKVIRKLKGIVNGFLPFAPELHEALAARDHAWYGKNGGNYRKRIAAWAALPDCDDDYKQCLQISGAVSSAWAVDHGLKGKLQGPNFTHYMMMRTLLYDLIREEKLIVSEGKTQSDGDARGFLLKRFDNHIRDIKEAREALKPKFYTLECGSAGLEDVKLIEQHGIYERKKELVQCINALAGIEQRMKLYLNPYTLLNDPETGKVYPEVTSMLVTHRMASSNPNGMQLAKEGESVYVRGFFLPDNDDHLVMSIDWKQIELVLIGEASGDPEFAKVYGQLPYQDLHLGAAADILSAEWGVTVTEEMFASLKKMPDDVREPFGFPLLDNTGTVLTPAQAYKYNRGTAGGKGANFGYWYSGALNSVATARGVGPDLMWKMTEVYRNRFAVGEQWRLGVIDFGRQHGYVEGFDGHRRTRFEATAQWQAMMGDKFFAFGDTAVARFGQAVINKVSRRAGNQLVNAMIQGGCGMLAKRSILRIIAKIVSEGFNARFMLPIHDELLFSVHKKEIFEFKEMATAVMTDHPDVIKNLRMDCSTAIGRTFQPFHDKKAAYGQIELDEAPRISCLDAAREGKRLNRDEIEGVVNWLYREAA